MLAGWQASCDSYNIPATVEALILVVVFCAVVGFRAGLSPGLKAEKLNPIQAARYE